MNEVLNGITSATITVNNSLNGNRMVLGELTVRVGSAEFSLLHSLFSLGIPSDRGLVSAYGYSGRLMITAVDIFESDEGLLGCFSFRGGR